MNRKFGVVSHILPPSPSGQAVVLYRLLKCLPGEDYCLMSRTNYEHMFGVTECSERLSGVYYHLREIYPLSIVRKCLLSPFVEILDAFFGILCRAVQIKKIAKGENCRLLIACTGDFHDLPAAHLASRWLRVPLIVYVFDDYAYQWTGLNRAISKRIEGPVLKQAQAIIVTNEYMQKEYRERHGMNSTVIRNGCFLPNLTSPSKTDKMSKDEEVKIVYTGAVYHAHYDSFRNLIAAIKGIHSENVKLHIYTAQPESVLKENGISGHMVVCHRHVDNSQIPKILSEADILFLPLAFESPIPEVIRTSAPGKTGEYLSVGRPILVHGPGDSFVGWYFRKNACGFVVNRRDPKILSRAIEEILTDRRYRIGVGDNARRVAERDFSIDRIRSQFLKLVESGLCPE